MKITPRKKRGDFLARSRFARFPIPEEKWGTTRSLACRVLSGRESRNLIQKRCRKTESLLGSRLLFFLTIAVIGYFRLKSTKTGKKAQTRWGVIYVTHSFSCLGESACQLVIIFLRLRDT